MPGGSVTTVFFSCDCARPLAEVRPSSLTFMLKSKPVDEEAASVVGAAEVVGEKLRRLHPSRAGPVKDAVFQFGSDRSGSPSRPYAPELFQESIVAEVCVGP